MKSVLVTGGNGFIARYVLKALLERGYKPTFFDRHLDYMFGIQKFLGDTRDETAVLDYLQSNIDSFLRTNELSRDVATGQILSTCKLSLQVSGDAGHVMETRMFEIGLINPMLADRTDSNKIDMDWAFEPNTHYIPYNSKEEMVSLAREWAADEYALALMISNARENIYINHTYDVRARQLIEIFEGESSLPLIHEKRKTWSEWN